ncbi:PREDICTED: dipeptidase 1-like [Nicrophorus vespilloides]|uniref:Dipeptidase n=1 Tax=Nicrophorus vespilloides TaxID=110193 RepID=A0ABM1N2C3_NICVS|nr:PREDICTED: dipeptidase 1-like [Nicrophorus vespilloides]
MDSQMDDPELIFEVSDQIRDCPCACDHVIYGPGYTTCLQEERFPPAPDVTRRLGATTPIGKGDTPPYYRAASVTNSSSTQSSRVDLSTKHWWIIVTVLLLAAAAGVGVPIALKVSAGASLEERLEFASRLLQEVPLIDGHNDLPWNIRKFLHNKLKEFNFAADLRNVSPWSTSAWSHTDLPRLKKGHVAAQFWAAYVPCDAQYKDAVQLTLEQIDIIRRFTDLYKPSLTLCTSAEEIKTAYSKNQICSLIGVEGGHSLAGSLAVLRSFYHIGVRYLTLTSTCNTPWADCSITDLPGKKPEHGGLSSFGKTVVKEMNRLGMIVDLSHVSLRTMRDALAVSKAPVIFSHSSAHSLCNSTRNIPDSTLRKLALNKGIVMVSFYSKFLTCTDSATVSDAVAHINHIRDVAGVDNVGLGAGYDGINFVPQGLEDVASYPTLFAELIGSGKWTVDDLKKLAGLNFLRVMQEVEKVRDEFGKAKVPPYEDVLLPRPKENNCSSVDN